MRALIQRVSQASVTIDGTCVSSIKHGFLVLLGVKNGDTTAEADFIADKILNLRVFEDDEGKMNRSLQDVNGELLVVSQFTLYGDARKGRRPSFTEAAPPEISEPLYEYIVKQLKQVCPNVQTGQFGADMKVALVNDGPVTIMLEK